MFVCKPTMCASSLRQQTRSRIVALAAETSRMEEDGFVVPQAPPHNLHHVARSDKASVRMSNHAAALPPFGVKPVVDERELLAAVVDLVVLDTREPTGGTTGQVLPAPISPA